MKSLLCLLGFLTFTSFAAAAERPNILYLYVDDMGWGSIGPNGQEDRKAQGKPYVLTPTLDKLAAAGVNFTRAYGCTVCSPARSSQQTGFHQGYTFADRNNPDNAMKAIRTDDVTMGDILAKAGYTTGYWGKWGYGGSKDMKNPTLDNIQTLPTSHGYQHVVAELHHVRAHTFFQPTLWTAPAAKGTVGGLELKPNSMAKYTNNKDYSNYPANQNHPNYPKTAYCDDVYAFAALDFIRENAQEYNKTGKPFFGLFAAQIPHAPFGEVAKLPGWDQQYKDKKFFKGLKTQSQEWCAMVTRIDAHFGNLLAALEDPNGDGDKSDSVADNTLIIFQSDNGGPSGFNNNEIDANGGLSGNKGSIQEGGIRVPTLMYWPKMINKGSSLKAGSNTHQVIDCTDLLPTFCDLAGVETPIGLSGVSIAPLLTGRGEQRVRDFVIHEAGNSASIIRGKYKFVRARKGAKASKKKKGKEIKLALYDLDKDPAEKNNIAKANPELVKTLDALLTAEQVDQPAGFANTYHQWLGKQGSSISAEGNWSEYVYENVGKKYINESGQPKAFWIPRMANGTAAVADKNVEFLGLEVGGQDSIQKLTVTAKVTGRNEIRVAKNGQVSLEGGTLSSVRWTEIEEGGSLAGHGSIEGTLYCQGALDLSGQSSLDVKGAAVLGGELSVSSITKNMVVLKAESIVGRFKNSEVQIGGQKYKVNYSSTAVYLSK
ncbi:MAG: sulfatase-like hydrolase/transferase [Lentisphaerales bacterium]|nr:sulfatase-like hydrolase/transferase [Lentisphaerales bacterium]